MALLPASERLCLHAGGIFVTGHISGIWVFSTQPAVPIVYCSCVHADDPDLKVCAGECDWEARVNQQKKDL